MISHRRQLLITEMQRLGESGLSCAGCPGTCCTFEANSMLITPLEAVELLKYLRGRNVGDLRERCREAVLRFRLDRPLSTGRGSELRRTYTCPFFTGAELGCPLPATVKPYGCLGFNPHGPRKASGDCRSDQELLRMREATFEDFEIGRNEELRRRFRLAWQKAPIPVALLELWDADLTPAIED